MSPHPPTSTLFPYTTLFRSPKPPVVKPNPLAKEVTKAQDLNPYELVSKSLDHAGGDAITKLRTLVGRSEEHTSELQSRRDLVCRLLLEKKKKTYRMENMCVW